MSKTRMYGVVLWADAEDRKAVIWCEDHGNLAFYTPGTSSALDGVTLDAGDLVQFDLREEENLRIANNPQLVVQSQCPNLARRLNPAQTPPERRKSSGRGGNVLSISDYRVGDRRASA